MKTRAGLLTRPTVFTPQAAIRLTEWDETGRMRVVGFAPMAMEYGTGHAEPAESLRLGAEKLNAQLDRVLSPPPGPAGRFCSRSS